MHAIIKFYGRAAADCSAVSPRHIVAGIAIPDDAQVSRDLADLGHVLHDVIGEWLVVKRVTLAHLDEVIVMDGDVVIHQTRYTEFVAPRDAVEPAAPRRTNWKRAALVCYSGAAVGAAIGSITGWPIAPLAVIAAVVALTLIDF